MLTQEQLSLIFAAVAEKYEVYLTEKGSDAFKAFEDFKSAIQQMNQPTIEMVDELLASGSDVVTNFLKELETTKKPSQPVTTQEIEKKLREFKGKLNGFKVTLHNALMNSSRAIFLSEAGKEASCLGIDEEAISKFIALAAHPHFFGQFKMIVTKLKQSFDKDLQLKTAIESALKACNPEVSLGDPRRQEKLRELIYSTVQKKESLLYILQNLNIVSTQRFAAMTDLSLSSFKKEVLLEAYRTSLARQGKSPFDSEGHISKFTQHFLDHFVPAATYASAVTIEKKISLKQEEALPEAINIKKSHGKPNYELTRINVTPVDVDNPKHWLCYHLGDAVNCCLHAGGNSERCIIDGLTKSTSGFYVITEKKGRGNAKEKICAAIYAFMSRKGNLVLDSIEPLNTHGKSEYASLVHDLVMEFAASIVQDTQREHPIQRVCLGTGGNTPLCFNEDMLTHKALSFRHEQTQEGTLQYGDSNKVIVLAHSPAEEERLQALINALVGTREESETEDAQRLRIIVRELLLTYCADLFYVEETTDIGQYIAHLKSKGLQQSFQREEASPEQTPLTLESFYKEAFTLMLPWVCQDKHIAIVDFFLKKGVDINTADSHGKTALCIACRHGQIAIIESLLTKGVNVNLADKEGKTPLIFAAQNGHVEIVRVLLQAGAEVNIPNRDGNTLLSWAAQNGNTEIVTALLDAGADVNIANRAGVTPLLRAAERGDVDIVKLLLAVSSIEVNRADIIYGESPLFCAVRKRNIEIVTALLKANADVNIARNGKTPLYWAVERGDVEIVRLLLAITAIHVNCANRYGDTPLLEAIRNDNIEIVTALIGANADVNLADRAGDIPLLEAVRNGNIKIVTALIGANADVNLADRAGDTPLLEAVRKGNIKIVTALLDAGADVNIADRYRYGDFPLLEALQNGNTEIVTALLDAGANVNIATNDGYTPLYLAAESGDVDSVRLLLAISGIDVNCTNRSGEFPLLEAVRKGNIEIVTALLEAGANVNLANNNGYTPIFFASDSGNADIVKLLLDAGADLNTISHHGYSPLLWTTIRGQTEILQQLMNTRPKLK